MSELAKVISIGGRVPPNDLDAEAAVLSAMLLSPSKADEAVTFLTNASFYSDANQAVFEAIRDLRATGQPTDTVAVAARLRSNGLLRRAGGVAYLARLTDATPAVGHLATHCRIVQALAYQRAVLATCHEILAEGYQPQAEISAWLSSVESRVLSATQSTAVDRSQSMSDLMHSLLDMAQGKIEIPSISTGYNVIDRATKSIRGGQLIVIAGRTGMGKSALAQCLALNVGQSGGGVMLFSIEMASSEIGERFLGQYCGHRPPYPVQAHSELAELPITIDDTSGIQIADVRSRARRAASRGGLSLVIVDYLQRLGRPKGCRSREEEVAYISGQLKEMAMELQVPVVALAQLNRESEKGEKRARRPRISDLRESGAIEQDANQIWLIHREGYYSSSADQRSTELIIAKNRSARPVCVELQWHGESRRFTE